MSNSIQAYQSQTTTTTSINPSRGIRSQIKQDVQSLSTALQSGDLATAQKSYADLQKILQSSGAIGQATTQTQAAPAPAAGSLGAPLDAVRNDFQELGHALQSGDLAAAQKDFTQLATDSEKVVAQQDGGANRAEGRHRPHRPPPPAGGDADDQTTGSSYSGSSSTTTSTTVTSSAPTATPTPVQPSPAPAVEAASTPPPISSPEPAPAPAPASGPSVAVAPPPPSTPAPEPVAPHVTASAYEFKFSASFDGPSNADPSGLGQLQNDALTIGKDLESGNLEGAQKDYAKLINDAQKFTPSTLSAANQYKLSASFESVSFDSGDNGKSINYQTSSFDETIGSHTAQPNNAYQFTFQAAYKSQSLSYLG